MSGRGALSSSFSMVPVRGAGAAAGLKFGTESTRVCYAAQSPWIMSGTMRDNVLFGLPMDQERYRYWLVLIYGHRKIQCKRDIIDSGGDMNGVFVIPLFP